MSEAAERTKSNPEDGDVGEMDISGTLTQNSTPPPVVHARRTIVKTYRPIVNLATAGAACTDIL